MKNKQSLREMWATIQCTNTYLMEVPNGEEGEKTEEKVFKELMAEHF